LTAVSLLGDLRATGVLVAVEGGKLKIRAPRDVLTQELLSRLKSQKSELLRILKSETLENVDRIDRTRSDPPCQVNCVNSVNKIGDNNSGIKKPCYACKGTSFWRHVQHSHWLCSRCHPPSAPDVVGEEHEIEVDLTPPADWGTDVEPLVNWFHEEGQYILPAESFHLTPWLEVISPEKFKESMLFDLSHGPDGPRNRYGAVVEDLKRIRNFLCDEGKKI